MVFCKLGEIMTAWLPSVFFGDYYPLQFAYVKAPQTSVSQIFAVYFHLLLQEENIDKIIVHMKRLTWEIPKIQGSLQPIGLKILQIMLNLQNSNLMPVAVQHLDDVRLLVLDSNGFEKMYSWFE
ncbi:hypothetical protein RHMOL_Rhmol10G0149800 [Rhododendron molle]|uniref:Uncharacterized protein n=1 Tax=Rhododendron molle TaxID=49168 RepID=A0ACC0M2X5_RHOML|nr:hypothetical protein RHMOL_Rhmol10G0149800 [Rhododendron molle]